MPHDASDHHALWLDLAFWMPENGLGAIPEWLGGAALGALLAAIGYVLNHKTTSRLSDGYP